MLQCQSPIQHIPASMPDSSQYLPHDFGFEGASFCVTPGYGPQATATHWRGGAEIHGCQCNTTASSGRCRLELAATWTKSLNSQ